MKPVVVKTRHYGIIKVSPEFIFTMAYLKDYYKKLQKGARKEMQKRMRKLDKEMRTT